MLTPNPNECNSTPTSVTGGFPLPLYYNRLNSSPVQNFRKVPEKGLVTCLCAMDYSKFF